MPRSTPVAAVSLLLAVATSLTLASCSDPSEAAPKQKEASGLNTSAQQDRITAEKDPAAAALLPAAVRDKGTITIVDTAGSSVSPPLVFVADDNKTPIGVEVDLAYLFASKLGLKLNLQHTGFENQFLGVDSGRYDAIVSNITVTEDRKEKYEFATYRKDDISFEAVKGKDWRVKTGADIAGKTIAVSSGTNQEKILVDWNKANVKAGQKPAKIVYFQTASDYYLALESGRIDAYFGPSPSNNYHAATSGKTEIIGTFSGAGNTLQGLIATTSKKGSGLAKPFAAAINSAIKDGSYQKVLARWKISNEAVSTSQVNPPGLPKTD